MIVYLCQTFQSVKTSKMKYDTAWWASFWQTEKRKVCGVHVVVFRFTYNYKIKVLFTYYNQVDASL